MSLQFISLLLGEMSKGQRGIDGDVKRIDFLKIEIRVTRYFRVVLYFEKRNVISTERGTSDEKSHSH